MSGLLQLRSYLPIALAIVSVGYYNILLIKVITETWK